MAEPHNILIIGLSGAGAAAFKGLLAAKLPSSHRIVAVEALDYAYWPIGALRASVVPGWETKITAPLTHLLPDGSPHLILGGTKVTKLDLDAKVATLDAPREELGGATEIHYEYAVVATGSEYPEPCRPPPSARSATDAHNYLKSLQSDIASSERILIVGAGPVGVEFAGEVAGHFGTGKKTITLVSSGAQLFPSFKPKLGTSLADQLSQVGIRLILGARANTEGRATGKLPPGTKITVEQQDSQVETVEADFLFVATGNKPATSIVGSSYLDQTTRQIAVDSSFGVVNAPGTYAVGDVMNRDPNLGAIVAGQAKVAVQNIVAEIRGKETKAQGKTPPAMIVVPVGEKKGAGQLFGLVLGSWFVSMVKGKGLFVGNFLATYGVKA